MLCPKQEASTNDLHAFQGGVLFLGNFDGLHLGHRELIEKGREEARRLGVSCGVLTFSPHPKAFFQPGLRHLELMDPEEKGRVLKELGVDFWIEEPFQHELAGLSPEVFVDRLIRGLNPKLVLVGEDFCFGAKRSGNVALLRVILSKTNCDLIEFPTFQLKGARVSSTWIRRLLADGDVSFARRLMGGVPYSIKGKVLHGDARGRGLGFPTANLLLPDGITVGRGVYVTQFIWKELSLRSVTNMGTRPTFTNDLQAYVETHVLDQDISLYGEVIRVAFLDKIRDEKKFSGVDALRRQISLDIDAARTWS